MARKSPINNARYCSFCKNNKEREEFYTNHVLKDENFKVVCPILKLYTCPKCQVVGRHTASYCPTNTNKNNLKQQDGRRSINHNNSNKKRATRNVAKAKTFGQTSVNTNQREPKLSKQTNNTCYAKQLSASFSLPQINKPGGSLNRNWYKWALNAANEMPPEMRIKFFTDYDYNPERYEIVRQAAYIADYLIMNTC